MNKLYVLSLLSDPTNVERALLGLLARQTASEQRTSTTTESNGRGFNYQDAPFGTSLAKWVKAGRQLTPRQLVAGRKLCAYYWRQVAEMPEVVRRSTPRVVKATCPEHMACMVVMHDPFQFAQRAA